MRRVSRLVGPLNAVMSSSARRQIGNVDAYFDKLVGQAEAASGGSAAGDQEFVESMRYLLRQVARVRTISPIGWTGFTADLKRRMTNRFRVRRLIAEHPEILLAPIERPIIVTGLPRTATTLAHKVLAQPEGNRAPLMWELQATDRADIDEKVRKGRIQVARSAARFGHVFSPVLPQIHAMEPESPEECVFALPHGRNHLATFRMPAYREWLDQHDFYPDYLYYRQVLQVLQFGAPQRRWVLKSPYHLEHLGTLMKVFPDAQIVWTHRDPNTVMGSWCSLMETGVAICNREYDTVGIGRDWLEMLSRMVDIGRNVRTTLPREAVVDVSYHQITADPDSVLPGVFSRLGLEWTPRDEQSTRDAFARPGFRRHEYSLSRYGLDADQVDAAFGDYARMVHAMR